MRQRTPWQNAIVLTLFGAAIATACVVSSDSDGVDDDDGGSGGFGNSTGKGGSSKGGTTSKGGSDAGGETSSGGDTSNTGGDGPAGGAPAAEFMCDPDTVGGQGGAGIVGTPYPDCEPVDADNDCQVCIQMECCVEQQNCNAFEPNNVCGYGGPPEYQNNGGEFLCWQDCMNAKVEIPAGDGGAGGGSGLPDTSDLDMAADCLAECTTPQCGLYGNQTNELAGCVFENCGDGICIF